METTLNKEFSKKYELIKKNEAYAKWLNNEKLIYINENMNPKIVKTKEDFFNNEIFVIIKGGGNAK